MTDRSDSHAQDANACPIPPDTEEELLETISVLMEQIEDLRDALGKIADHEYSDADCISDGTIAPGIEGVWQAIARRALARRYTATRTPAGCSDIETAFADVCEQLGCKRDNEDALRAILDLQTALTDCNRDWNAAMLRAQRAEAQVERWRPLLETAARMLKHDEFGSARSLSREITSALTSTDGAGK